MRANRTNLALSLLLVMALALTPAAALAQKAKAPSNDKVNLNTATPDQLEALPGVGPAMAKRIIEHRTKAGKFTKIEDLLNVKGVGEKKFQKIKERLVVQ